MAVLPGRMADTNTERVGSDAATSRRITDTMPIKNGDNMDNKSERKLTVLVEMEGDGGTTAMELMRCVRELCGGLLACRFMAKTNMK